MYTVKKGDNLSLIAARYGMTLSQLISINPQIRNPNLIYPGQSITTAADVEPRRPSAQQTVPQLGGGVQVFDPNVPATYTSPDGSKVQYTPAKNIFLGTDPQKPPGPASPAVPSIAIEPTQPAPPQRTAPPPPPTRSEFELESSKAFITAILTRYGLGNLADWAWRQIGLFRPDEEILLDLREQDDYIKRFPGMNARFEKGLNAITEEQYLSLERTYFQIMRASGLPTSFYDGREDFTGFIVNDLSPAELQSRIDDGYARVTQTDPAVRAAFEEFYGGAGDAALAAMFVDPDRAAPLLIKQARTAEVAGIGRKSGVNIGQGQSEEIAAFSPSAAQINAGFSQVGSQADLDRETFTEFDTLRSGDLISAAFNTSGASEARQKIRQRRNARVAAFSGGGGAAFFQGQGFIGSGVADS